MQYFSAIWPNFSPNQTLILRNYSVEKSVLRYENWVLKETNGPSQRGRKFCEKTRLTTGLSYSTPTFGTQTRKMAEKVVKSAFMSKILLACFGKSALWKFCDPKQDQMNLDIDIIQQIADALEKVCN